MELVKDGVLSFAVGVLGMPVGFAPAGNRDGLMTFVVISLHDRVQSKYGAAMNNSPLPTRKRRVVATSLVQTIPRQTSLISALTHPHLYT